MTLALVREAEYRANLALGLLEGVAQLGIALLVYGLIYGYAGEVAGWSAYEALVLLGIYRAVDGLLALQVAPNMMRIAGYVASGELDHVLLRPVSSQFLVSLRWLQPHEAANVLIGIGLALYAAERAGVRWTVGGVASAAALSAAGLLAMYSLWFASVTLSFWLVRVEPIGFLFYDVWQTARYPLSYFRGAVRILLTVVFPVAFATTFPAEALLGRGDLRLVLAGGAMAAATLFLANRFWSYAVRRYSSASS